jgi:dolichol-phosphate mannosyltransferase
LLGRPELYELMSEVGFIRIWAVFNDFVYRPLTPTMIWMLRNLSVVLENAPAVRTLAGSILVQAQKPPRSLPRSTTSLAPHEVLRASVSVVIPCHNEEMNIGPLADGLRELFDPYLHEIIAVDDNSTDATRIVIEALAAKDPRVKVIVRTPPGGVGRALADGFRAATGRWVLSMDCDFQHLLPEIRDLFDAAADGADVVVGSRFSRHSVLLNYPFQKIVANRAFHTLAQIALRRRFRDLTNNLKLMRREVAERLRFTQPGFAANAETGLEPLLMGYAIKEVPISWIDRTPDMGVSSFRLARVGGGYWQVLLHAWLGATFGTGRYQGLRG